MKRLLYDFYLAVLGGICIAIGGTVFLSVDNKVIGAFLFSIGLISIVTCGLNLYTGKIGYVLTNPPKYLLTLLVIWIGNFCGTFLTAALLRTTRIAAAISDKAASMCEIKLADSPLSIFILGIFCGILMYLAVNGYKTIIDPLGRYLAVILGVAVFILCGFEHCVANMFYFAVAGKLGGKTILYLLIMTAGNSVGSIIFATKDLPHNEAPARK